MRARRLAVLCLAVFLTGAIVASAHATLEPVLDPVKQNQDLGPASCGVVQATGNQGCVDTEATPIAKPAKDFGWSQVAGAEFPAAGDGTLDRGATLDVKQDTDRNTIVPADVDFFTLAVKDETDAYAGGSECKDPVPADKSKAGDVIDYVRSCERVPVIYHYTQSDPDRLGTWTLEYRGDGKGSDGQGYVGGLAYTTNGLIVAVGGTGLSSSDAEAYGPEISSPENGPGAYPYREDCNPAPGATSAGPKGCTLELNAREAGTARVWVKHEGSQDWCEAYESGGCDSPLSGARPKIDDGAGNTTEMGGLTAFDCSPRASDNVDCVAGGYRQLWEWHNDEFNRGLGPTSPGGGAGLSFRVRSVKFTPGQALVPDQVPPNGETPTSNKQQAVAVTAGCCAAALARDVPAVLTYNSHGWSGGGGAGTPAAPGAPDSFYSVVAHLGAANGTGNSTLTATGGPAPGADDPPDLSSNPGDRCPQVTVGAQPFPNSNESACVPLIGSSVRLTSVDGGPDWGAGSLGGTGEGVLWTPHHGETLAPDPLTCPSGTDTSDIWDPEAASDPPPAAYTEIITATVSKQEAKTKCTRNDQGQMMGQVKSQSLVASGSFSLNVLSLIYSGLDRTGETTGAWSVGDRGAIMHLGAQSQNGGGGASAELPPPVGDSRLGSAADRTPYAGFGQSANQAPDAIPALSSQPLRHLARPALIPAGIPDATRQGACQCPPNVQDADPSAEIPTTIAMSRDGTEGWALGSWDLVGKYEHTALFHFRGGAWTRCDPIGVKRADGATLVSPDPACSGLAGFVSEKEDSTSSNVKPEPYANLTAATRVPLENDSNPANDNDFEVVAVGFDADYRPAILWYRNGRWTVDRQASAALVPIIDPNHHVGFGAGDYRPDADVAFVSPDDGWVMFPNGGTANYPGFGKLLHYDGRGWTDCSDPANSIACGDPPQGPNGAHELQSLAGSNSAGDAPFHLAVAGSRVYLAGTRKTGQADAITGSANTKPRTAPVILHRDPNGTWSDAGPDGLDPGFDHPASVKDDESGQVTAFSVTKERDGYAGWAMGEFGAPLGRGTPQVVYQNAPTGAPVPNDTVRESHASTMLRLGTDGWTPWTTRDASEDYLLGLDERPIFTKKGSGFGGIPFSEIVPLGSGDESLVFPYLARDSWSGIGGGLEDAPLTFDSSSRRWAPLTTPFISSEMFNPADNATQQTVETNIAAAAPDNQGGAWVSLIGYGGGGGGAHNSYGWGPVSFYHYTREVPKPVFDDVSHPIRDQLTAATGDPDGTFWVTDDKANVYRYDRITGWDRMTIPGWDKGRIVINPSPATAIAVGPGGRGIVVGKAGRIADITPAGVQLDAATQAVCRSPAEPPCGTGRTLRSADVGPDGSALVGGDHRAILWRPAGGSFRAIDPLPAPADSVITGVSLPRPGQAWVTTDGGRIFAGQIAADGSVTWRTELKGESPDLNARSEPSGAEISKQLDFRAIDLNGDLKGYAVGSKGLVFERTGDPSQPWRRVDTGFTDNYTSVAISDDEKAALIGGEFGRILTLADGHFEVAREADRWSPYSALALNHGVDPAVGAADQQPSAVLGVAIEPGSRPGETEAWAANQSDEDLWFPTRDLASPGQILHYSSDPADTITGSAQRAQSIPDSPPARAGEISFATFGKSDCQRFADLGSVCPAVRGSNQTNDIQLSAIVSDIAKVAKAPGGPSFALYTGDANDEPGTGNPYNQQTGTGAVSFNQPTVPDLVHKRFQESVIDPLARAGLPLYSALGGQDVLDSKNCRAVGTAFGSKDASDQCRGQGPAGSTALGWRHDFTDMPAPWGSGEPAHSAGQSFCPAGPDATGSVASADTPVADPATGDSFSLPTGGARTHYAFDIRQGDCSGTPIARVAVVDTSLGSLVASASNDQPHEVTTQLTWLKSALCIEGDPTSQGETCTRTPAEQAIVLSEDPPYSYGPTGNQTEQDATALEALLSQYRVNVLVSGKLGWNGLDWALAPGIHSPCPGESYPDPSKVPELSHASPCQQSTGGGANDALSSAEETAAGIGGGTVSGGGERCQGPGPNPTGTIPEVTAASAGGKFAPSAPAQSAHAVGDPRADLGYWHGYTVIRLDKSGDPRCTIVETRPVYDWVGIDGGQHATHVLRPGQSLALRGYGREPNGFDTAVQYDAIESHAITHRYDLLYADPEHPWLPKSEGDNPACNLPHGYCPITDSRVGTVDPVTGEVKAGDGSQPRVYALVELSVGEHVATYPLVFEPRPSFRQLPAPPAIQLPPASAPPPAPAPPAPAPPFQPPTLATPPPLTPLPAQTPPVPPAPPLPPGAGPAQLDLFTSPPVLSVAPTISLFPPSPPVINVAPPTPARPVEKAKKVAVQSSGSDSDAPSSGREEASVDTASNPPGAHGTSASTRHENNFTALAHRDQASAWARDLQWGGGLTLMALVAAFGWVTVRPTPRRRAPEVPAPNWSWIDRR